MLNARIRFQKIIIHWCLTAGLVLISIGIIAGCTSKYGRIQRNTEVTELFETQQILPDHTYYYNGFEAIPYVIVGIDNQYTLRFANLAPGNTDAGFVEAVNHSHGKRLFGATTGGLDYGSQ